MDGPDRPEIPHNCFREACFQRRFFVIPKNNMHFHAILSGDADAGENMDKFFNLI